MTRGSVCLCAFRQREDNLARKVKQINKLSDSRGRHADALPFSGTAPGPRRRQRPGQRGALEAVALVCS